MENKKEQLVGYYNFVYQCPSCNNYYGSDVEEKTIICPECIAKLREQKNG